MENPPGIYLEAAIATWRQELLAQPNLASADRNELEVHLRDIITELYTLGLSDEEAFLIARRRVGPPQQIAEEFFKADPARVWRERIFWMTVVLLAMNIWGGLVGSAIQAVRQFSAQDSMFSSPLAVIVCNLFFYNLPFLGFAVFFALGLVPPEIPWVRPVFKSRRRFIYTALAVVLATRGVSLALLWGQFSTIPAAAVRTALPSMVVQNAFYIYWPLALIALIAWLMPASPRGTPKIA